MDKATIQIATITWARNKAEEMILRESLQQLAALNIPVIITDGGSDESFLTFLRTVPHFTVLTGTTKGVYAQAANSLLAAYHSNAEFIFYTEPDKEIFFRTGLLQMLDKMNSDESLGIYMASRSTTGFETFPSFQQMTETTINNCCAEIVGKALDYTYGPFLLNRKLVPYLNMVQQDIGWGWRPYIFVIAHRLGYRVESFIDDFVCPPEQRADDATERIYRIQQLEQNSRSLVLAYNIAL
jgi:hypothetical protein